MPLALRLVRLALDQRRNGRAPGRARAAAGRRHGFGRDRSRTAQRGENRQPAGRSNWPGHDAGDGGQHAPRRPLRQAPRAARRYRDDADRRTAPRVSCCSTCWPAYCTTTRCAVSATTPMSWVISTSPMPVSCRRRSSRSRICAWMVTSSAVVGSSAISSFGRQAIAIAIITRWLMPPESWCGKARQPPLGIGDADLLQQLDRAPLARGPCRA